MGKILSPHGVKGQVKLLSHTEIPSDIVSYGPLFDKSGKRRFNLTLKGQAGGGLIAGVEGVATREAAESLRGIELYVPRSALPKPKTGQYYQSDLVGLPVLTASGEDFGTVAAFHNFGAGVLVEIRIKGDKSELYSFNEKTFPVIAPEKKKLVIVPPEEIEG